MISYVPGFVPNKIMIIGGGGTGSRLVPLLGQFLKTCAWIQNPEITIIDDDIVEEKNLLRQNFIQVDVGKPKAEVLAQRYSRAFNINIIPRVERVKPYDWAVVQKELTQKDGESIYQLFRRYATNSIIIMCVDSPEARRHIVGHLTSAMRSVYSRIAQNSNVLLIDSGNENDFGQISVAIPKTIVNSYYARDALMALPNSLPGDFQLGTIPIDLQYYSDMKAETTLSCADLDQTMAINTMMAVTMFGVIQNFYYARPISFHRVNVTLSHGATPEYINPTFLKRVLGYMPPMDRFGSGVLQALEYQADKELVDMLKEVRKFQAQTEAATKAAKQQAKAAEQARIDKLVAAQLKREMEALATAIKQKTESPVEVRGEATSQEKPVPAPVMEEAKAESVAKKKKARAPKFTDEEVDEFFG